MSLDDKTRRIIAEDDAPRSMRDAGVRERRKRMLNLPHLAPLTAYAGRLRRDGAPAEVPEFDPLDGGTDARVLFLFEKPGPMTAPSGKRRGSGFISRNNDDATAEATSEFMQQAGIPRTSTVIWNLIPWWNDTRKVTQAELHDGVKALQELIGLLPHLRAVVMVGRRAAQVRAYLEDTHPHLKLFNSDHPSPIVRARWLDRWEAIPSEWAKVRTFTDGSPAK
jgi:hypothetical protein